MEVAPGPHEVFLRIDWARSQTVELDLGEGETAHLECEPKGTAFSAPLYAFFRPRQYLELRRVEPGSGRPRDRSPAGWRVALAVLALAGVMFATVVVLAFLAQLLFG